MENVHGKEISLQYVTVKVPGQKPRGSRSVPGQQQQGGSVATANGGGLAAVDPLSAGGGKGEKVLLTGYELIREPSGSEEAEQQTQPPSAALDRLTDTPNVKKRHRRIKSNGVKANADCEGEDQNRRFASIAFVMEVSCFSHSQIQTYSSFTSSVWTTSNGCSRLPA